jgi:hypothetical protein
MPRSGPNERTSRSEINEREQQVASSELLTRSITLQTALARTSRRRCLISSLFGLHQHLKRNIQLEHDLARSERRGVSLALLAQSRSSSAVAAVVALQLSGGRSPAIITARPRVEWSRSRPAGSACSHLVRLRRVRDVVAASSSFVSSLSAPSWRAVRGSDEPEPGVMAQSGYYGHHMHTLSR